MTWGARVLATPGSISLTLEWLRSAAERDGSCAACIAPRNCFAGGQSTNCKINGFILAEILKGNSVDLWSWAGEPRKAAEAALISAYQPPWNGQNSQG